jgi:hypothetical protein
MKSRSCPSCIEKGYSRRRGLLVSMMMLLERRVHMTL